LKLRRRDGMTTDGAQRLAHVLHRGVGVSGFRTNGGRDDLSRNRVDRRRPRTKIFPILETRAMKGLAPTLLA
jgi:hypothetical protein